MTQSRPEERPLAQDPGGPTVRAVSWAALVLVLLGATSCLVLIQLGGAWLDGRSWRGYATVAVAVVNAAFGGLLVRRLPRNAIGWILLATSVSSMASIALSFYAIDAAREHLGLPGQATAAWLSAWCGFPSFGLLVTLLVLLFPDGRAPSRRWRWVARGTGVYIVVVTVLTAITSFPRHGGPVGVDERGKIIPSDTVGGDVFDAISGLAFLGLLILCAVSVTGLFLRRRRASAVERQQLKWFLFASSFIFAFGFLPHFVTAFLPVPAELASIGDAFFAATFSLVPVAAVFAILRYRLYDLDLVINRTLVYGALAAFITAVYVGIVVGVGSLVGRGTQASPVLSIIATTVVAVAFQPVRERVQRVANRLVYGQRASPYEVLSEFSARVAESYAGEQVLPRMARVLAEGTGADRAVVWLRSGHSLRSAATWPAGAGLPDVAVELAGDALPNLPGADRAVAVRHRGELLGSLSVSKRPGEALTPIENKLLDDLAHQAGLVLRNVGLTAALKARLIELRASRQRLVAAQDEERRRLERNLHDGAQQHLVALRVKLGLAETFLRQDPGKARATLAQLKVDADEALTTLRDLARGIYPPLLADKGLVAALESQGRKASVVVRVHGDSVDRYPQDVESAVYFCCLEALQNVQKYANARAVEVTLRGSEDGLDFCVADDGAGFTPGLTPLGNGLQNMHDRIEALGGALSVESSLGTGTQVRGTVPLRTAAIPTAGR